MWRYSFGEGVPPLVGEGAAQKPPQKEPTSRHNYPLGKHASPHPLWGEACDPRKEGLC